MRKLSLKPRNGSMNAFRKFVPLSQLLHPPLLDEAGLISATRWMVDGFSARANIKVELKINGRLAACLNPSS